MKPINIARRYAQALYQLSHEKNLDQAIQSDLRLVEESITQSEDLTQFLNNLALSKEVQQAVMESLFKDKCNGLTIQFFHLLIDNNRLDCLLTICQIFEDIYLEKENIQKVKIKSRFRLNPDQVQSLSQFLKERLGKTVVTTTEVDPSLLGGVKIQVGDKIYDYTIDAQLERFRRSLLN